MARLKEIFSFAVVGVIATAMQFVLLSVLVQTTICGPVLASAIGFALSAIFNYWANRRYTFRSSVAHREGLPRFVAICAGGLGINTAAMWIFTHSFVLHYLFAQFIATGLSFVWNYYANRTWTFAHKQSLTN